MNRVTRFFTMLPSAVVLCFIAGCSRGNANTSPTLNQGAFLTGDVPTNPMQWRVVTSTIDRSNSTMATLYGNDIAVEYVRTHARPDYPAGAELSLVTWSERDDPHWFGAKIPQDPKSVEFVTVGRSSDGQSSYSYAEYEGAPLRKTNGEESGTPNAQAAYILSLRAAVMP